MRDDLVAFLGETSGEFVSWLWNLLLKSAGKPKLCMSMGHHNHSKGRANMLSNDEKEMYHATFAPQLVSLNDNEVSDGSQRLSTGYDSCMDEIYEMEGKPQALHNETHKRSAPSENYYGKILKYGPSRVKVYSGTSACGDQNIHVDQIKKLRKEQVLSDYCKGLPRQCLYSQKKELPPRFFDSVSRVTSVSQRRASTRPADSMSDKNAKPRGTVWDRLGRPCEDKRKVRGKEVDHVNGVDVIKRMVAEHPGEEPDQNRLVVSVPGGRLPGRLTGAKLGTPTFVSGPVIPHHTDKSIKKRHFSDIDSDFLQDRENLKEVQKSSSVKCNHSEIVNSVSSSGARQTSGVQTCQTFGTLGNDFFPGPNKVSPRKLSGKVADVPQTHLRGTTIICFPFSGGLLFAADSRKSRICPVLRTQIVSRYDSMKLTHLCGYIYFLSCGTCKDFDHLLINVRKEQDVKNKQDPHWSPSILEGATRLHELLLLMSRCDVGLIVGGYNVTTDSYEIYTIDVEINTDSEGKRQIKSNEFNEIMGNPPIPIMGSGQEDALHHLKPNYEVNLPLDRAKELATRSLFESTCGDDGTGGTTVLGILEGQNFEQLFYDPFDVFQKYLWRYEKLGLLVILSSKDAYAGKKKIGSIFPNIDHLYTIIRKIHYTAFRVVFEFPFELHSAKKRIHHLGSLKVRDDNGNVMKTYEEFCSGFRHDHLTFYLLDYDVDGLKYIQDN